MHGVAIDCVALFDPSTVPVSSTPLAEARMKLINDSQRQQLIDNYLFNESVRDSPEEVDYQPVVKLFTPDGFSKSDTL